MKGDDTGWFGNADVREKTGGTRRSDRPRWRYRVPAGAGLQKRSSPARPTGKSWTCGVLMEEFERTSLQFVCWDASSTQRSVRTTRCRDHRPQEDQTIDMPAFIQRLKSSGKSVVINLMGLSLGRQQLVGDFCAALESTSSTSADRASL